MNNRINSKFEKLRNLKRKALITYITAGDPSLEATCSLVQTLESAGADIIELGVPYSDPLADGPVIQKSSHRALEAGTQIEGVFDTVSAIRQFSQVPIVLLAYYNSIFKYGMERFAVKCSGSGVDGLIIPDLPMEERKEVMKRLDKENLCLIPIVTPTSCNRIKEIVEDANGFVYCVSTKGTTGMRKQIDTDLKAFTDKVKSCTTLPIAIGFGVSDSEMVKTFKKYSDGVIVGSAIISQIEKAISTGIPEKGVFELVKQFSAAVTEEPLNFPGNRLYC